MSDCSANAWRVPAEREPGVLYMHGHPGTDYAAVTAIEVDGQMFERVRTCKLVWGESMSSTYRECSECGIYLGDVPIKITNYCPNCGARVRGGGDD